MKRKIYYLVLPFLVLAAIHLILGSQMKVPVVWPDEYTYLFISKYFAGEEILNSLPRTDITGSFGYSLLISPAFRLFDKPEDIYSFIISLNGIFSSTLYISLFLFLRRIAKADDKFSFLISFVISLYPAYLLQSNSVLTDTLTPSYFLICIVAFHNMVDKKNLLSVILFAVAAGFLNWIHVRMLPFTLISIVFIFYLLWKKEINPFYSVIAIGIMAVFVLMSIIIGDNVNLVISGSLESNDRIITSLLSIAEIVLIFSLIFLSIYFLIKRKIALLIFTIAGLFTGLTFSSTLLSLAIIPITAIVFLIKNIKKKNNLKLIKTGLLIAIPVAIIAFIALPEAGFFTTILNRIRIWFINMSGVSYYAMFSTFVFGLIGIFYILFDLHKKYWIDRLPANKDDIKDFSTIEPSGYNFAGLCKNPVELSLLFMLLTAIGMVVITVFPNELTAMHYRADHLFYGRYIEVILAGFIAYGLYSAYKSDAKTYLIVMSAGFISFFIISILIIFSYSNQINTELSFHSVLSFFPFRAVLGNINIFIFSFAALIIGTIVALLFRFKPVLGSIFFGAVLFSFSIFTYYYVHYYYQIDKQERNKIITSIRNEFSDIKQINYDLSIFSEKSQNGLHYIWEMPDKKFNLIIPRKNEQKDDITIGSSNYGVAVSNEAVLYTIEHDGYDHLWVEKGKLQQRVINKVPNYFNINLAKDYVAGVFRSKLYADHWINGRYEMIVPNIYHQEEFNLEIVVGCTNKKQQNLIVWLENDELFNQNIPAGVWKYNIKVKSKDVLKRLKFRFFSDLTREIKNQNQIIGLSLLSVKFIDAADFDRTRFLSYDKSLNNTITLEPRRNIDMSLLNLKVGDTLELPFWIRNYGNNTIELDKFNSYLKFKWYDFVFKSLKFVTQSDDIIRGTLKPGETKEIFVKFIAPEEPVKYFVDFDFSDINDNKLLNEYGHRQLLIDLRRKEF